MLRHLFGGGRAGAADLGTYFAIAGVIYLALAIALFRLQRGDDDGGTGPRPEPKPAAPAPAAPINVPDRPPAEWFSRC